MVDKQENKRRDVKQKQGVVVSVRDKSDTIFETFK